MEKEIVKVVSRDPLTEERERIKKSIRLKKEKNNLGQFEKGTVECPVCGSRALVTDYVKAEIVCSQCNTVIESNIIDHGPEWRAFDMEQRDKRSRCGPPANALLHDKGLSTIIDWKNRDMYGRTLSPDAANRFRRMRTWQRRIRVNNAKERNVSFALSELSRMVSALGLPRTIHEEAAVLYKKASEMNLIRGRSAESVASALLYAACRIHKNSRTLDEIAAVSRIKRLEMGRNFKLLSPRLGLKIDLISETEYIPRFISELGLPIEVYKITIDILSKLKGHPKIDGKRPSAKAAAAIWIASETAEEKHLTTQDNIERITGVTTVTIRNLSKEILNTGLILREEIGFTAQSSTSHCIIVSNKPIKPRRRSAVCFNEQMCVDARAEASAIIEKLGINGCVLEKALLIYEEAVKCHIKKGRLTKITLAGSLYASCRVSNIPVTLDEIASASELPRKKIGAIYLLIRRVLGPKLLTLSLEDLIGRYCAELGLNGNVKKITSEILNEAIKRKLNYRMAESMAATALFVAADVCGEAQTKERVAKTAGITSVSIRNTLAYWTELVKEFDYASDP